MQPSYDRVEALKAKQAEMKDMLDALETGKIHIGNPWEGRTEAKIGDLQRKISDYQLLIENIDADRSFSDG